MKARPRADNRCMRALLLIVVALALVPAASAETHGQTISGTISANSGASLTISKGDHSLTCSVTGTSVQAAIAHWGVGVRAAMACKQTGDGLVLARLTRLGAKDGNGDQTKHSTSTGTETRRTTTEPHGTTTEPTRTEPTQTRRDARGKVSALGGGTVTVSRPDGSALTCSITDGQLHSLQEGAPVGAYVLVVCGGTGDHPALISVQRIDTSTTTTTPAPTPPPTTAPERRTAIGVVTTLSGDAVTVKPDAGEGLRCRITGAADSAAAAAKLTLGAHVGIVCRRDGDGYVLSGVTSAG